MKTNAWSVVLLAGSAAALPGFGGSHGGEGEQSWGEGASSTSWGQGAPAGHGQGRPTGGWGSESTSCTEERGQHHSTATWSPETTSESSVWSSETPASSTTWSPESHSSVWSSETPSSSPESSSSVWTSSVWSSSSEVTTSTSSSVEVSPVSSSSASSSSWVNTWSHSSSAPYSSGSSSSSVPYSSAVQSSSTPSSSSTWVNTWSESTPVSSSVPYSSGIMSSSSVPYSSGIQSSSSVPYSSGVKSSSTWVNTWSESAPVSSSVPYSSGVKSSSVPASSGVQSSSTWVNTWSESAPASSSVPYSSGVKSSKASSAPSTGPATSSPATTWTWSHGTWTNTVPFSYQPTTTSEYTTWVTEVTTEYTTVCPVTATWTNKPTIPGTGTAAPVASSGVSTGTWTYMTTSTVTTVYTTTVSSPIPQGPETTVTEVTTEYTTVCPYSTKTWINGPHTGTTTLMTTSTLTSTYLTTMTVSPTAPVSIPVSPVGPSTVVVTPVPVGPTSPAESGVTVTQVTTAYVTTCPVTETKSNGESTWTTTYETTSHVTSTYYTTVSTEAPYSEVTWGSNTYTYQLTHPVVFPTTTKFGNSWGNGGWGNGNGTASATGSGTASASGVKSRATGSAVSSASVSSVRPSGTKPASVSGVSSAVSSGVSSTGPSKSTSTCSRPTGAPLEGCVPCAGQPGKDPKAYCGLTINDDSYKNTPKTCNLVKYDFTITNTTVSPDGVERLGLLINGQFPGPKIEANWGDTIQVTFHNELTDNGTSIHFHGQRQYYTNEMDGVSSITQCPIAPGQSQTYTFVASNYGTSWYHSHFGLQIYDGIFGPMVIHGPASAEYDDEEFIVLQDWNHVSLNKLYDTSQDVNAVGSGPQTLDTGLINGMNVWGAGSSQTGKRFTLNVESGKSYRLRILNSGVQTMFKFYIDGHSFQVIAADYVPIKPYSSTILNINCGQRYDIVFKADQPVGNYWMRADAQQTCTTLKNPTDIKAVVHYAGAAAGTPTSSAYTYVPACVDEPLASLVPVVPIAAGPQTQTIDENIFIGGNGGSPNLYKWTLSGTTFVSQWDSPTLGGIIANGSVPDWSGNLAITVPNLGEWVYIIIESPIPVPHPIHLHGHDFLILAQGYGSYSSSVALNTVNPARRDTALMPSDKGQAGYLVIAFETDNPGAWLLHCHIGWHSAMGLALQIIENLEGITSSIKESCAFGDLCDEWATYAAASEYAKVVVDAGI